MEDFCSAIIVSLLTLSGSFACTCIFACKRERFDRKIENMREEKDKIRIIKEIFMSLLNNRESFIRERNVLKDRIEKGSEALLRLWPINPFDYYGYRRDVSFLLEESGVKIFEDLYNVNVIFLKIQRIREEYIPVLEKYSKNKADVEKNTSQLEKFSNACQNYIDFVEKYYLSTANKLMEDLKVYAENELNFRLVEPSLSEDKVSLLRFRP